MRQIKFRFWNKLARRFQPASKYAIDGEGKLVSYDYEAGAYDDPIDFKDTIIVAQQYTGFKDKNDKEIYEGDIFKGSDYKWDAVEFKNGQFQIHLMGARLFTLDELFDNDDWERPEVIGNVFEKTQNE